VLSTTVLAPTAREADALSTAFFILGPEATLEFCRNRPELAALLVCSRDDGQSLELVDWGFPPGTLDIF
jgi:thiamine biosynthesis lipoprotein